MGKRTYVVNGGKRVNVRKLAQKLYKLEDEGTSEELVAEIRRTIHMELKRRRDKGCETDKDSYYDESENEDDCVEKDQSLEIFGDISVVDSTLNLYNDQAPIQKVHKYDETSVLQNFLTTRFESNEEEYVENETVMTNIVEDPIELAKDCNEDVDVETLVKAETDEEWLQGLIEDHDMQEVSNSREFFKDEEDTITQELQGLSNPLPINPPPLPLIGLNVCASRILLNDFVSRYPPLETFDSHTTDVCKEETIEVPDFYVLYTLPSVNKNKFGGNFYRLIASVLFYRTNICVKLIFAKQVTWKDPQLFRLLVYGEFVLQVGLTTLNQVLHSRQSTSFVSLIF
ncbi:uncharacterized protein LOC113358274 [Papaver somniferum]|uniref:uncharacterized protein LOC113358274 n=1 Tax=Papaver somniferum TaxID=3469 RepID=UPI000E705E2B|nr:uncharacterized protein LOC113358274 [Papaver somniferum]